MSESTPTRRRQPEQSNTEFLASITGNDDDYAGHDDSKARRNLHLQMGPLVISGAAIDRVRARFISL